PYRDYFVMLTEPNREMTAQANLIIRRIPFYLPTIFRVARISQRDMRQGRERPDVPIALFPGLIFIATEVLTDELHQRITSAPGIRKDPFLRFGVGRDGAPQFAIVTPRAMAVIQDIEASERDRYFARKRKHRSATWTPEVGQEVRVLVDE